MNELANERSSEPTLREQLIALVRKILGPSAATRLLPIDARLADLGMSSLKMVNLMLSLEVQFDLTIPQAEITPENFESITSVEALVVKLARPLSRPLSNAEPPAIPRAAPAHQTGRTPHG